MKKEKEADISFITVLLLITVFLYRKLFWFLTDISVYPPFSILFTRLPFHYANEDYNIIYDLFYELKFIGVKFDQYILDQDYNFVYTGIVFLKSNDKKRKRFFTTLKKKVGENNYYLIKVDVKTYKINFIRNKLSREMLTIAL